MVNEGVLRHHRIDVATGDAVAHLLNQSTLSRDPRALCGGKTLRRERERENEDSEFSGTAE